MPGTARNPRQLLLSHMRSTTHRQVAIEGQQTRITYDPTGATGDPANNHAVLVEGYLFLVTGIDAFGIAVWDETSSTWVQLGGGGGGVGTGRAYGLVGNGSEASPLAVTLVLSSTFTFTFPIAATSPTGLKGRVSLFVPEGTGAAVGASVGFTVTFGGATVIDTSIFAETVGSGAKSSATTLTGLYTLPSSAGANSFLLTLTPGAFGGITFNPSANPGNDMTLYAEAI